MDVAPDVAARLDALERLVSAQAERIEEQSKVIGSLRTELSGERNAASGATPGSTPVGRRDLLGGLGKVAVGAVAGSAAISMATASPVAAATFVGDATGATPGVEGNTNVTTAAGVKATSGQGTLTSPALLAANIASSGGAANVAILATVVGANARAIVGDASGTTASTGIGIQGLGGLVGVKGTSSVASAAGVLGQSTGSNGVGVKGDSSLIGVQGDGSGAGNIGVKGTGITGVQGVTTVSNSDTAAGVLGQMQSGAATAGAGVRGEGFSGVRGVSNGVANSIGVKGSATGTGSVGVSGDGPDGVNGTGSAASGTGVKGSGLVGVAGTGQTGVTGVATGGAPSIGVSGSSADVGSIGVDGVGATGVRGRGPGSGASTGVLGSSTSASGIGVDGQAATGVRGLATANGTGVRGDGTAGGGIGGVFVGARADAQLGVGTGVAGPNRSHSQGHVAGELAMEVTSGGVVWVCVGAGAVGQAGTWKRFAYVENLPAGFGPDSLTGRLFTALAAPGRVYDSRKADGKILNTQSRDISVALTTDGAEIVPVGATAVVFNITLTATQGTGFLSVFPSNITNPGTSAVNWYTTGQILANGGTVTVPANRTVTVNSGGTAGAGATHFIIDVTGYYS